MNDPNEKGIDYTSGDEYNAGDIYEGNDTQIVYDTDGDQHVYVKEG